MKNGGREGEEREQLFGEHNEVFAPWGDHRPQGGFLPPLNTLLCYLNTAFRAMFDGLLWGPQLYYPFKARKQKDDWATLLDDHKIMTRLCEWERALKSPL